MSLSKRKSEEIKELKQASYGNVIVSSLDSNSSPVKNNVPLSSPLPLEGGVAGL
jgi:hypothetical protein